MKETTCAKVIHILLLVMFTGLFVVGIAVTGVNLSIYDEHVILSFNNPLLIAIYLLAGWLLFAGLSKLYDRFLKKVKPFVFAAIAAVLMYALAIFWIVSAKALPQSDAEIILGYAKQIHLKEIGPGAMGPDDYLIYFPYQYGLVTFMRVMMSIFGTDNVFAMMCVIALSLPVIALAGAGIVCEIAPESMKGKSVFFLSVMLPLFLPLYFYSCFIYGDLPFAAMSLCSLYFGLKCVRKPSVISGVFFLLSCFLNYLLKSNALIICVALVIFFAVNFFDKEKRKTAAVLALLTVLSILGVNLLNKAMYDRLNPSGYDAIPMSASIAMGLNDDNGNAGWCNFYHQITFVENDFDAKRTSEVSWGKVRYEVTNYIKNPVKGLDFLYRKINLQWNTPMFQALAMINSHDEEAQNALARTIYDSFEVQWKINSCLKAYQIFVYFSMAAVLWITRKKKGNLSAYLPGIAIFGSFLFSLIWEAKTRYILPPFVMIVVCAAVAIPVVQEHFKDNVSCPIRDRFESVDATERKHYNGIDLFKFIMAILVVAVHVKPQSSFDNVITYRAIDSLTACAVGFFFVAAGFLLGEKMTALPDHAGRRNAVKDYIFRMLKLYLIWTAIYLPLEIFAEVYYYRFSVKDEILLILQRFIFIGEHFNSWILWYLLSSIYALLFVLLMLKLNVKESTLIVTCSLILLFSFFLDAVSNGGFDGTPADSILSPILRSTIGNGRILRGFFFLPMGMYLSTKKTSLLAGTLVAVLGYALGFTGLFGEVPFMFLSIGFFIVSRELRLKDGVLWPALRKMSVAIYFTHLYVWTILYLIIYGTLTRGVKMFVYTVVVTLAIAFLYVVAADRLNKRKRVGARGGS